MTPTPETTWTYRFVPSEDGDPALQWMIVENWPGGIVRRVGFVDAEDDAKRMCTSEQARQRAESEGGWMKRVLHGIKWFYWMKWVEGPWYATGDMEELAFFQALKAEEAALGQTKEVPCNPEK
jgi:hypothetical protein